jgi:tripartite-type tricarboxylate transporter receptor subunit TctC
MSYWFAAYAPAKTPVAVVKRLNDSFNKALASDSVKGFFSKSGLVPFRASPEEMAKFQAVETEKWGRIIKAAGIQPE